MGVGAAMASSVILRSLELRCVSSPDPVLGEGGAGSEGGGVCCGGVAPPWESVLLRRPPSLFGASSFGKGGVDIEGGGVCCGGPVPYGSRHSLEMVEQSGWSWRLELGEFQVGWS